MAKYICLTHDFAYDDYCPYCGYPVFWLYETRTNNAPDRCRYCGGLRTSPPGTGCGNEHYGYISDQGHYSPTAGA